MADFNLLLVGDDVWGLSRVRVVFTGYLLLELDRKSETGNR